MKSFLKYLLVCTLPLLLAACSGDGLPLDFEDQSDPGKPPNSADATPDSKDAEAALTTTTALQAIDANDPVGKLCYERIELQNLPLIEANVTADGNLEEWEEEAFLIRDPGGDALNFDIHQIAAALVKNGSESHLAIAVRGHDFSDWDSNGSTIHFHFGSLLKDESRGATEFNHLRKYRYSAATGLQRLVNDSYIDVASSDYQMAIVDSGTFEFKIVKSELDEVLLQPLWSLELEVDNPADGDIERTGRFFYKNILSYPTGFKTFQCLLRMGSNTISVQEFIDEDLLKNGEDEPDFGSESDVKLKKIEKLLAITRASLESAWILLGKPITQYAHHSVVVTTGDTIKKSLELESHGHLSLYLTDSTKLNPYFTKSIFESSGEYFIRQFVDYQLPHSPHYIQLMLSQMLSEHVHKGKLGTKYWLETYQQKTNTFSALADTDDPVGIENWQQRFLDGELSPEAKLYFEAKTNSLALILNRISAANTVLAALRSLKTDESNAGNSVDYETLFAAIDNQLSGAFLTKVTLYYNGWFSSGSYLQDYSPFLLSDEDLDGLPRFYETNIQTNPGREDTDMDGWTDLAEVFALSDPRSASSRPNGLMADGSFGDWQELLPDLVQNDNGSNSVGCPAAADISHHAALYDRGRIIIAASGKDLWAEPPFVRWEVQISIKGGIKDETFTLRTVKNRYHYDVLEGADRQVILRYPSAKPLGIDSMEWYLDFSSIDIDPSRFTKDNFEMTYRISTLFEDEKRILCDDTPWTQPLFSTTEAEK